MSWNNYTGNVVPIRPGLRSIDQATHRDPAADAFSDLTASIIMARHARGELEPALLAALLAGVGFKIDGTA